MVYSSRQASNQLELFRKKLGTVLLTPKILCGKTQVPLLCNFRTVLTSAILGLFKLGLSSTFQWTVSFGRPQDKSQWWTVNMWKIKKIKTQTAIIRDFTVNCSSTNSPQSTSSSVNWAFFLSPTSFTLYAAADPRISKVKRATPTRFLLLLRLPQTLDPEKSQSLLPAEISIQKNEDLWWYLY